RWRTKLLCRLKIFNVAGDTWRRREPRAKNSNAAVCTSGPPVWYKHRHRANRTLLFRRETTAFREFWHRQGWRDKNRQAPLRIADAAGREGRPSDRGETGGRKVFPSISSARPNQTYRLTTAPLSAD